MAFSTLAETLHRLMSDAHLSSSELGRRLNMPAPTVKKLRTGENTNPTISTLLPVAKYFGLTVNQLIGDHKSTSGEPPNIPVASSEQTLPSIPLIRWEEAIIWPSSKQVAHQHFVVAEKNVSEEAYALAIEIDDYGMFQKGGLLFIDPAKSVEHNDYVLIYKDGQALPTIKRILKDDGEIYMQSLVLDLNITLPVSADYKILGVVIAYKKWFKL